MTSNETRGAPRRRDDPVSDPRPRPEAEGQSKRRGRARTSKTSSPRRMWVPAGSGRARQRNNPRAPDRAGRNHDADVRARDAGQVNVRAQG